MFRFYRICLCVSLVCFPSFVIAKPTAEIAKPVAKPAEVIAKPVAKPADSLEFENSLVKVSEFDSIIRQVGGQFTRGAAVKKQILQEYPKCKQHVINTVNARLSAQDPKLVDSLASAEKYFNATLYPLFLAHLTGVRGGKSNLIVKDFFTLPNILYRLNLVEFAIESSQKFKNFSTYQSDLLLKINSKIEKLTLELDKHPHNEHYRQGGPELSTASEMGLQYFYQEMLKAVCSKEKNIKSFVDQTLKGEYISRFGCQKPDEKHKGVLSTKCLPVSMMLRLL